MNPIKDIKIYFASDHAGFELKNIILAFVRDELGFVVEDCGAKTLDQNDDYPDFVSVAAEKVSLSFGRDKAIIFGASGQGEAMVANRYLGVRAAVYYGEPARGQIDVAGKELGIIEGTRVHNNANILSVGARFVNETEAKAVVKLWLETEFLGEERHQRRINKIDK